jgi:hypothetical protein
MDLFALIFLLFLVFFFFLFGANFKYVPFFSFFFLVGFTFFYWFNFKYVIVEIHCLIIFFLHVFIRIALGRLMVLT